eukprot:GFUD01019775.1.p1 GENE.GFUD01019775.1~~GFUD01019775.1.p1  ORF type:complete len:444 (-),score=140.34 GFUD01019775.1:39-1370(-)
MTKKLHLFFLLNILPPLLCSPFTPNCPLICCLTSLTRPLPTCVPPSAGGVWGRVTCTQEHCLVHSLSYDQYSVPQGRDHYDHGQTHPDKDDPCPAKEEPHRSSNTTALEVKMEISVNSISNIRLDENSFTAALSMKLSWSDPNLALCSCHREEMEVGKIMMSGDIEDWIWVPDFTIWETRTFEREQSLTKEKLNKISVENRVDKDGIKIDLDFDMKASITCQFNTTWYPFDSNMCKVQMGSYSNNEDKITFQLGKAVNQQGLKTTYNEYNIKLFSLTGKDAVISFSGQKFRYGGFKFLLSRNHEKVEYQFTVSMSVMVLMALGSSLIPTRQEEDLPSDRTGLLSGSLISAVLIFQFAVRTSPAGSELTLTPLIEYILISLVFIGLSFMQYCLLSASWFQVKRCKQIDLAFFLLSSISYVIFVLVFWEVRGQQAAELGCHNVIR